MAQIVLNENSAVDVTEAILQENNLLLCEEENQSVASSFCELSERTLDKVRHFILKPGPGTKRGFALIYPKETISKDLIELPNVIDCISHKENDINCNKFYYFKVTYKEATEQYIISCQKCYFNVERIWETHPEGQIWMCHFHDRVHVHCMMCRDYVYHNTDICPTLTELFEYKFPNCCIKIKTTDNIMWSPYSRNHINNHL